MCLQLCSVPYALDALDRAYEAHVQGSSMGVDFAFDDEEDNGKLRASSSSNGSDYDSGIVEVRKAGGEGGATRSPEKQEKKIANQLSEAGQRWVLVVGRSEDACTPPGDD